jgi:manganese oxidase
MYNKSLLYNVSLIIFLFSIAILVIPALQMSQAAAADPGDKQVSNGFKKAFGSDSGSSGSGSHDQSSNNNDNNNHHHKQQDSSSNDNNNNNQKQQSDSKHNGGKHSSTTASTPTSNDASSSSNSNSGNTPSHSSGKIVEHSTATLGFLGSSNVTDDTTTANNNNNNNNNSSSTDSNATTNTTAAAVAAPVFKPSPTSLKIKSTIDAVISTQHTKLLDKAKASMLPIDVAKKCNPDEHMPTTASESKIWWRTYLTDFRCGHVTKMQNGTILRQFTLIANDNHGHGTNISITKNATDPVQFPAWTFNNTVPGPTMRFTKGDHVRITVINSKDSLLSHSLHMHSIHTGAADGMSGPGGTIAPGTSYTYSFIANPIGVYPYHCHMEPVQTHIMRGLYGMMIIDPPNLRPAMSEMVMMLNGFSFNKINETNPELLVPPTAQQIRNGSEEALNPGGGDNGQDNQFYAVNTMVFGYMGDNMINLKTGQEYRIYVVNMVEFDPVNNFHLHGNLFDYYPSGTATKPSFVNDVITLSQGDRGILEFKYNLPGMFMFHSHINRFSELGWVGMFNVSKP